jgi:transposase
MAEAERRLGTRFLPATKAIPKEMLTGVDRPILQRVVDEAREAGIEHFIFVTGRNKGVIEDHFDSSYELEDTVKRRGKAVEYAALERPAFEMNRRGFPNRRDFDSTCWLGGGQQEMAKPYSQDLRDRVIDAVRTGKMSRRAAARHYAVSESVAVKWLERVERQGSREPAGHGGHRASKLMPHREFLEAARAEKSDVTLQALCNRLSAKRGVKADTSMMSRFFRKIGVTFKKRRSSLEGRAPHRQGPAGTLEDGNVPRRSSPGSD